MGKIFRWGAALPLLLCCLLLALAPSDRPSPASGPAEVPAHAPLVALTFDDGPRRDTTSPLLDGLALREVPATFFLVGANLEGNEDLVRRMREEGHQIGVHTYDHVLMTELTEEEFGRQLALTRTPLGNILGEGEFWLRPPYGILDESVLAWADSPLVLWSLDPEDWDDKDPERIASHVLARAKDGDIILMHDIYPSSVRAALDIVDGLIQRGFDFVTVEQLMALRGVEPRRGQVYLSLPSVD